MAEQRNIAVNVTVLLEVTIEHDEHGQGTITGAQLHPFNSFSPQEVTEALDAEDRLEELDQ